MISFMSEHTAEYVLVHDIVRKLESRFPQVIPIYLWLNREGNSMGRQALEGMQIKLVAIFPRGPKVGYPGDERILVKFNSSILRQAFLARSVGIPVLAGVPLVSNLSIYRIDSKSLWFILDGSRSDWSDLEIVMSSRGEMVDYLGPAKALRGPCGTQEILLDILSNAKEDSWDSWLNAIREIRTQQGRSASPWFWAAPKPVFLVIL